MTENTIKLLLVEDDPNLGTMLKEFLETENFEVSLGTDGKEGLDLYQHQVFDICVLDVMIPKMDGFTLAKLIRQRNTSIPIIFLTAKSLKEDKIKGFQIGADDYLTKPFSMEELKLRLNAVLKRTMLNQEEDDAGKIYEIGDFRFDFTTQLLEINDEKQRLTTKEAQLLRLLCRNLNKVTEREIALKRIWGNDDYFTARSMDVFITKLRKYLKKDPTVEILNVHGTGFKLTVNTEPLEGENNATIAAPTIKKAEPVESAEAPKVEE